MEILLENASKPFLLNSYEQGFRNMYFIITRCCRMYDITLSFHTPLSATGSSSTRLLPPEMHTRLSISKQNTHPPKCLEHRQHQNRPLHSSEVHRARASRNLHTLYKSEAEASLLHRSCFFIFFN